MIKRILSLILLVVLIMSLAGCNNSANSNELDQSDSEIKLDKDEDTSINDSENKNESQTNSDTKKKDESEETNIENSESEKSDSNKEESTNKKEPNVTNINKNTISLSIEGPDDDLIYKNDEFELTKETMTALELLNYLQDQEIIRFEYMGKGNTAYLKGIGDYYEFDFGPLSGWIIEKNGEFPLKSIGVLEVSKSDEIRFRYTKELGDDLTN